MFSPRATLSAPPPGCSCLPEKISKISGWHGGRLYTFTHVRTPDDLPSIGGCVQPSLNKRVSWNNQRRPWCRHRCSNCDTSYTQSRDNLDHMDNFLVVFVMVPVQFPLDDTGLVVGGLVGDRLVVGRLLLLVQLGLLCQLLQLPLHLTVEK